MNYNGIIPYNTAAIKELDAIVQSQQQTINQLQNMLNNALSRIEALEAGN